MHSGQQTQSYPFGNLCLVGRLAWFRLMKAIWNDNNEVSVFLLHHPAIDVNFVGNNGFNALTCAVVND